MRYTGRELRNGAFILSKAGPVWKPLGSKQSDLTALQNAVNEFRMNVENETGGSKRSDSGRNEKNRMSRKSSQMRETMIKALTIAGSSQPA